MHIFLSAGEPSGDLHGANLVKTLRLLQPNIVCTGFGGERMEAAGCRLHYPLSQLAVMGFVRLLSGMTTFLDLVSRTDRFFKLRRPDAVVLIDFPGFNWWLARRAHYHGIPVFYFVPPQLWGWASWRVRKMQRWVDHVLCALPFEEAWFRERGVRAHYVGHPYFDELPRQVLSSSFQAEQQARSNCIIGLLPGSRTQEVKLNLSSMIRSAQLIHQARPDSRFLVACYQATQSRFVEAYLHNQGLSYVDVFVGRTPEIIALARACIAVSGSVGLELLYHAKPSVVVYRTNPFYLRLSRVLKRVPYIGLVNLLAGRELFPEFLTDRCQAEAISGQILRWLNDPAAYAATRNQLMELRQQVAQPGACERAATYILELLGGPAQALAA